MDKLPIFLQAIFSDAVILRVKAKNRFTLYVDGFIQYAANMDDYRKLSTFVLPDDFATVAVKVEYWLGGFGSFMASATYTNNPRMFALLTDGSWKCSSVYVPGWERAEFNSNNWQSATTYGVDESGIQGPMSIAEWIWTDNRSKDSRVYCRSTRRQIG